MNSDERNNGHSGMIYANSFCHCKLDSLMGKFKVSSKRVRSRFEVLELNRGVKNIFCHKNYNFQHYDALNNVITTRLGNMEDFCLQKKWSTTILRFFLTLLCYIQPNKMTWNETITFAFYCLITIICDSHILTNLWFFAALND